ncbi:MAG: AAA family ATPase [Chloroflexota bacterium]|nr:AAA family ATPase [Chloroflexota bacterium]
MPSERIQRQINRLLDEAEAAASESDWPRVRELARDILAADGENPDAVGFAAMAARRLASGPSEGLTLAANGGPDRESHSDTRLAASFVGERYQVRRFLGEGAMKRVYLAHDTKLARDIAFALIKTEQLDADGLVRVRREAQAMGRLGDHPHIVTVHDIGVEDGSPYIVTQFMAGGSVEELLRRSEGQRLAGDHAVRIAEEICQALEHAHSRGIIHRDLKPGNVWLTEDGGAALGDFGLAVAIDHTRMTVAGMMLGTASYMAPEQALGRVPDARSDLYALGAMLYKMTTGRVPFLGDDAVAVISQHINTAPVAPSWHNPDVPKALELLILRLLAKSPDARPASAADVVTELRRILDHPTQEAVAAPQSENVTDLRGLDWGRFVGRQEEMDQLKLAFEGALSGKGSLVMLIGEAGVGKSRLAAEFLAYAGLRGAQVTRGRCYEGEVSAPYRPFVEALQSYVRPRANDVLREELGAGAPEIAALVSEIRHRLPDIPEPRPLDEEAERFRLFDSLTQFICHAAKETPLVIFLDDLHWADKPSLLLLRHLLRGKDRARLLVLGAYRDVDLQRGHPLEETLITLRQEHEYTRVRLHGLQESDVADLLNSIDSSEENAAARVALTRVLYQETEGNPFFLREIFSHLIEEGKLYRERGRWASSVTSASQLGIPEGVRSVVGRRLSRLSDECNRMLTVVSTMTSGFSWQVLTAVSGEDEDQLVALLEEALAAQLIQEIGQDGSGAYDFTHALVRQTLYEEMSTPRRVLLHRRIGQVLEQLYASNIDAHVSELAHHFYQAAPGGDVEKAIRYAIRAGDRATELAAYEDAVLQYQRGLQATELTETPGETTRCELFLSLGESLWNAGEFDESKRVFDQAANLAGQLSAPEALARAALGYGGAFAGFSTGIVDEMLISLLERALQALGDEPSVLKARVQIRLAEAIMFSARRERIDQLCESAVTMARAFGDAAVLSSVLQRCHWVLWRPDNIDERLAMVTEAARLAQEGGASALEFEARYWRLHVLLEAGEVSADELDKIESETFAAVTDRSAPYQRYVSTTWRTLRLLMQGRLDEAEPLAQQGLILGTGEGARNASAIAIFGAQLGGIRQAQGRMAELDVPLKGLIDQYPAIVGWRAVLALVYAESGRPEEARSMVHELAPRRFEAIPRDAFWTIAIAILGIAVARVGGDTESSVLYDLLLPYAGRNAIVPTGFCTGSVALVLGMLAATERRWDDATRHFDDAIEANKRLGTTYFVITAQSEYGRMLLARGAPGDAEHALVFVQSALDAAEKLGLAFSVSECVALKIRAQDGR